MQQSLEQVWFPMRFAKQVFAGWEETALNFSISIARKTVWANAVLLATMNEVQKSAYPNHGQKMVRTVGELIINPVF